MLRTHVFALSVSIAVISGCASTVAPLPTPEAPSAQRAAATAQGSKLPTIDWPAERSRISRALAGSRDVSVIARDDDSVQLLIPGAEAFARDGIEPRPSLRATLDNIATVLAERPETEILVLGHTDGAGSELHNMQLSIRRAEAVAEYLRTRGIALTRLQADGRGETEPFADNATEAGRAKNRRVEIIIRPFVK